MKSFCSVMLMLVLLGTLCAIARAQEDVSAAEGRPNDPDKFDLVWPEEPGEKPDIETEPPQGRPMLRIDIDDIADPGGDVEPDVETDRRPASTSSPDGLTTLIVELRTEVSELRHEIRRLRTTVELLSARISGSQTARTASTDTDLATDAEQGGFHPFWLPQP